MTLQQFDASVAKTITDPAFLENARLYWGAVGRRSEAEFLMVKDHFIPHKNHCRSCGTKLIEDNFSEKYGNWCPNENCASANNIMFEKVQTSFLLRDGNARYNAYVADRTDQIVKSLQNNQ